jgi:hypothetical protein
MRQRENNAETRLQDLSRDNKRLREENRHLREENEELRLLPDAPGYLAAKSHFEQIVSEYS